MSRLQLPSYSDILYSTYSEMCLLRTKGERNQTGMITSKVTYYVWGTSRSLRRRKLYPWACQKLRNPHKGPERPSPGIICTNYNWALVQSLGNRQV